MTDVDLGQFPAPYPHESLRELGPDVFFLAGPFFVAQYVFLNLSGTCFGEHGELADANGQALFDDRVGRLDRIEINQNRSD